MSSVILIILLICFNLPVFESFSHSSPTQKVFRQSSLLMAPRYDSGTQKWIPQTEDDFPQAGYPPTGSLFRAGPKAFLMRVFNDEGYEQSVLKYMAREKCSRNEAQGNMDGKRQS
jgi:hypothetical protein